MSDRDRTDGRPSRRSVLRATAAASGALGLAGCTVTTDDGIGIRFGGGGSPPDADGGPTDTPTGTPTDFPEPAFDQDCIGLDPENVELEELGDGYRLLDGGSALLSFEDFENAKAARNLVEHYGFTRYCFVGRPDPPMVYWLANAGE